MPYEEGTGLNESPLYFAYRRVSSGYPHTETFHSHRGMEVLLVHEGRGTLIVGNVSYAIRPGMVCVFQPYQLHHLKLEHGDGGRFERSLAIFEPTLFEAYFEPWPALHAFYGALSNSRLPSPCLYGAEEAGLAELFRDMRQRLDRLTEAEQLEEISLFLVQLFRGLKEAWRQEAAPAAPLPSRSQHHAERVLDWIEQRYAERFQLEELARDLHLSPHHLSHLFKEAVGISITEYMTTRRMHQAVKLLTSTGKPVALVAEEVGFTNASYFCKLFKSRMGATPHQYRLRASR
ncbi:helix-turn-helix domain-containing protein [Paenibacillus pasadenensis]|uniref:ADA regulatory protein n=1 Tax=Paenibacillus pasadenensis TaxID=217090 RepID=A0A2N5N302_9BACL|nr:AraC family transcriptional regulator [Paenibacillus pasadenensis]PLT44706.1 ADA regulatory protein [Paenibacillus pasadenensis]